MQADTNSISFIFHLKICGTWYNKLNYLYLQAVCEETCWESGIRITRFRRKNNVTQSGRDVDMSGLLKKWRLFSYPLKRTKQETYFRKHWYVYSCCSYLRMTTPGSGLLSRWIIFLNMFFFLAKRHVWLFIIIHIFLFILKIIASVKNQHNLYFAVELQMAVLQWTPRYSVYICSWSAP